MSVQSTSLIWGACPFWACTEKRRAEKRKCEEIAQRAVVLNYTFIACFTEKVNLAGRKVWVQISCYNQRAAIFPQYLGKEKAERGLCKTKDDLHCYGKAALQRKSLAQEETP